MTSHVKLRRERVSMVEYDTQIKGERINFICAPITTSPSLSHPMLIVINMCSFCRKNSFLKSTSHLHRDFPNESYSFVFLSLSLVCCSFSPSFFIYQRCVASLQTNWRCWTCNLSRKASCCRTWQTTCGDGVRLKATMPAPLKNSLKGSPPELRGKSNPALDNAHNLLH